MKLDFNIGDVVEITREAGQLLLGKFETDIEIGLKGKEEIVTEADRASEALLLERLTKLFPGSGFCGEETGYHDGSNGMTWVVDPLDGTHNYSVGIPLWGCSVALLDEERKPLLGVLDFPTENRTLWGERGKGSFMNGNQLEVDCSPLLETSLIAVQSRIRLDPFPPHVQKTAFKYCCRALGAIAYHAALIAQKKMRAAIDLTVKLHDVAAAIVILEEAGGCVSNLDGGNALPPEHFIGEFKDLVLPFFAGDRVTGPPLLKELLPDGTPSNFLHSRGN